MNDLTTAQQRVLDFVQAQQGKGLPFPSLREIAAHFGYAHTTARFHLKALQKKGYIEQQSQRQSDYRLLSNRSSANKAAASGAFCLATTIAAGEPRKVYEEQRDLFTVDSQFFGGGEVLAVQVSGESMAGDAIADGDLAMIRLQSTVDEKNAVLAVRVDDEITLKRIRQRGELIDLLPSNPDYPVKTVAAADVVIVGKLVGVIRKTA